MFSILFSKTTRTFLYRARVYPRNISSFSESKTKKTQRPKRIILIRHGESLGNVCDSAYVTTPDWRVPLTKKGIKQSFEAGEKLRDIIGEDGKVFFYYSPYMRTKQTMKELEHHISEDKIISVREEPRISEQQFGNFQNVEDVWEFKKERHEFGRFYYRFQSGEAGLDVYSRVSSFISTLVRDCQQYQKAGYDLDEINVFSVEEFEESINPDNAQLVVMEKRCHELHRWYELDEEHREALNLPKWCTKPRNVILHNLEAPLDANHCPKE
eukprot:scaffold883_cov225-Chaetoceros_neogracile.AAC.7